MTDRTSITKICTKCGIEKDLDGFHVDKQCRHGRSPRCKECARTASRDWYARKSSDESFREQRKEQGARALKKWRTANSEAVREARKHYRRANREMILEQERRNRQSNPEREREKCRRRRARLLNALVATVDLQEIWTRDDGQCQICSIAIDATLKWPHRLSLTIDHLMPLSRGGTHEPANVRLAHSVCNSRKGDRLPEELTN